MQPLFSLATANPDDGLQAGQIVDVTGDGNTFVFEDLRVDRQSDKDYNDVIFQVRGATGSAASMDDLVADGKDWRSSDLGQALIEYTKPYIELVDEVVIPELVEAIEEPVVDDIVDPIVDSGETNDESEFIDNPVNIDDEPQRGDSINKMDLADQVILPVDNTIELLDGVADEDAGDSSEVIPPIDQVSDIFEEDEDIIPPPFLAEDVSDEDILAPAPVPNAPVENQPLIGIIDTGISENPDIDFSRITLGSDRVDGDDNPVLSSGEGNEHGTHVTGTIGATQDNGIGIDGINDDAPLWIGRGVGAGNWAESLVEYVDAFRESGQPNGVVNLSMDLTQLDAEGNLSTRYEFTPIEMAALEYARQNNVLISVAAGNDADVMSVLGQASQQFDNIITVGAAEHFGGGTAIANSFYRADYSSYGDGLDILADSGSMESPVMSTVGDGIGGMRGTSVATAKVTGAISQVWAANPDLSYRQVIDIIKSTATDLSIPNSDMETGAGLLNIASAVYLARVTQPEEYNPELQVVPTTWSGEGKFVPLERAVSSAYTLQAGDTLWDLAQEHLGDSNRWREITKDAAGQVAFSNTEAQSLPIGQIVYIPGNDPNSGSNLDQIQETAQNAFLSAFTLPQTLQSQPWTDFMRKMFERFYQGIGNVLTTRATQEGSGANVQVSIVGTPVQSPQTLAGKRIILDPGHGINNRGYDPGAVGYGTSEAVENLHQAQLIAKHLRQLGANVTILDERLSLAQIGQRAAGHDIFVSLHQNAFNKNAQGHEVFSHPNAPAKDAELAQAINSELDIVFPDHIIPNRGTKQANFAVLRNAPTVVPAVLVESLFIDAPGMSRANVEKAATAVARGIEKFFTGQVTGSDPQDTDGSGNDDAINDPTVYPGVVNANVGSLALNFRQSPFVGATILGSLARGTSVKITGSFTGGTYRIPNGQNRNDWYKVEVNGRTGYVAAYYVDKQVPSSPAEKPGYVNSSIGLNFRRSPSLAATRISVLPNGSNLTILGKVSGAAYHPGNRTDWYKVRVGQTVGYVAAYYVKEGTSPGNGGGGSTAWQNPLPGYGVSSGYGWRTHPITGRRSFHYGIDIAAPSGTPIKSAKPGRVVEVGFHPNGWGRFVRVNHDGFQTIYAHLSHANVSVGQAVNGESVIGRVGSTGSSTGPHLHFEVRVHPYRWKTDNRNPRNYINF
jgi:murein DD-endopeptidase MepM/ murein hydrolase activator NlpD